MKRLLFIFLLSCIPAVAAAATVDPTSASYDWITKATNGLSTNLTKIGFQLFYLLTLLQFTITLIGAIGSGEIDVAVGKMAKGFLWMFFCLYLMTNSHAYNFIANTIQYFLNNTISWTTSTTADFSSNGVIAAGLAGYSDTVRAINKTVMSSVPTGWSAILQGGVATSLASAVMASITLGVIFLSILFCTAYVALKVFMIKVETALILALLPFSLALLGLSALREQGFAPFKSMLALIYRIIILGVVVGGMSKVGANLNVYANSDADPNIVQMALVSIFGYLLLAFIAFKADQIASALAAGSANLGSGDMVGAALAGAAAGGAMAAAMQGVLGTTGGAGTAAQSMGDVLKKMRGEGSITNASSSGTGSTQPPGPAPTRAMASVSETPVTSSPKAAGPAGAPHRSQTEANPASPSLSKSGAASSNPEAPPTASTQDAVSALHGSQHGTQATGDSHSASTSAQAITGPLPNASTANDTTTSSMLGVAPQHESVSSKTSEPVASPGNHATSASISGAPVRESGSGKPSDPTNAPKREKTASDLLKQNLSKLADQTQQERQATHVSINTHQHD